MFPSYVSVIGFLLFFMTLPFMSDAGYLGGRAFITGKPSYISGPCYTVDQVETCPIGYTPCILGRCYYFPDHPTAIHKKDNKTSTA